MTITAARMYVVMPSASAGAAAPAGVVGSPPRPSRWQRAPPPLRELAVGPFEAALESLEKRGGLDALAIEATFAGHILWLLSRASSSFSGNHGISHP